LNSCRIEFARRWPKLPTLTLDDDELRALCDLLTDVRRQPNRFPLSPNRS
jgi:hypothetical protein